MYTICAIAATCNYDQVVIKINTCSVQKLPGLSISIWEFIYGGFDTRRYTLVHAWFVAVIFLQLLMS